LSFPVSSTHQIPEVVAPIASLMSSYSAHWALCGGWAVDSWLGEHTREHGDVDVSVFVQDQRALFNHLRGWQLVPHDPHVPDDSNELWDGRGLGTPGHLHCRPDAGKPVPGGALLADQGFTLDVMLDDRDGDQWVLWREPRISLPLQEAVPTSPWGLPTVAPEVLLFFKARDMRRRDKLDFEALLPHLAPARRAWLRDALGLAGHPWLTRLAG